MTSQVHLDSSDRDRIAGSGLFDPVFYRATYGERPGYSDPLRHFLDVGLSAGFLPSAAFDPVLYRLAVPSSGGANPLLHFLDNRDEVSLPALEEVFSDLVSEFTRERAWVLQAPIPPASKIQQFVGNVGQIAQARTLRVDVGGVCFRVEVPPPDLFFGRLRRNEPFAFARLTHGFWDAVLVRNQIASDRRLRDLPLAERMALAGRIALAAQPLNGTFVANHMDEVLALTSSHRDDERFFNSVALIGFPMAGEDFFPDNQRPERRAIRAAAMIRTFKPEDRLFDATLWKRQAFSGDLAALPNLCRSHPVVLVGSDLFKALDRRWQLQRFTHVEIPRRLGQTIAWQLLDRVKVAIEECYETSSPRPVVLFQCGSLAYWLTSRLFAWNPDVFYIDLGQALNIWFNDVPGMLIFPWAHYYQAAASQRGDAL